MNECGEIRDLLFAYVRGGLAGAEFARVDSHVKECEACRARSGEFGALSGLLDDTLRRDDAPAIAPRVMLRLGEARPSHRRRLLSWGIAAAALLALGLGYIVRHGLLLPTAPSAHIVMTAPDAFVERHGVRRPLAADDRLRERDTVMAGEIPVAVRFPVGSRIDLAPGTLLHLGATRADLQEIDFLDAGRIEVADDERSGTLRIRTHCGTIRPIGTRFMVEQRRIDGRWRVEIDVLEGTVRMESEDGVATAASGERIEATEGRPPRAGDDEPSAPAGPPEAGTDRYGDPLPEGALARLGTTRFRHRESFGPIAFLPDGRRLATSAGIVWNTENGIQTARTPLADDFGSAVAIHPARDTVAQGTGRGEIVLWNPETNETTRRWPAHEEWVSGLVWHPDGERIASTSWDGTVRIWNWRTGEELAKLEGRAGWGTSVAFSSNGRLLAAGFAGGDGREQSANSMTGIVRVWNVESLREVHSLEGHTGRVDSVTFHPVLDLVVSGDHGGRIRFWDPGTGELRRTLQQPEGGVRVLAFSPDGSRLVSGGWDSPFNGAGSGLWLWEPGNERSTARFRTDGMDIDGACFSPDGRTIACSTGRGRGILRFWDVAAGRELHAVEAHREAVCSIAFSPDGVRIATGGFDGAVRLWNARTGTPLLELEGHEPGDTVVGCRFLDTSDRLVSASEDGTIRLWNTRTGELLGTAKSIFGSINAMEPGPFPDAVRTLTAGQAPTWKILDDGFEMLPDSISDWPAVFSPDRSLAAIPHEDDSIEIVATASGDRIRTYPHLPPARYSPEAFTPDGAFLLCRGNGERLLLSIETGDVHGRFSASGYVPARIHPTGRFVAVPDGNTILLLNPQEGNPTHRIEGPGRMLYDFEFSPSGRELAAVYDDASVLVWNVPEQEAEAVTDPESLWRDLAEPDPSAIDRALRHGEDLVDLLPGRLTPPHPVPEAAILNELQDLAAEDFAVREQARRSILDLGAGAIPYLASIDRDTLPPEAAHRVEGILETLSLPDPVPSSGEDLRQVRAILILHRIGGPEAKAALRELAASEIPTPAVRLARVLGGPVREER